MEHPENAAQAEILLRPAPIFALFKSLPFILYAILLLFLAWRFWPPFVWLSFACLAFAAYRYTFIRTVRYLITSEVIRISRGIFFKRTDQVELYRVKDYILTQPLLLQVFRLMDLTLKSTDAENPVIWLRGIPRSDLIDVIREYVQTARMRNKIIELN